MNLKSRLIPSWNRAPSSVSSPMEHTSKRTRTQVASILDDVETGAISRLDSHLDENQVYDIMLYEVDVIQNKEKNLSHVLRDFVSNDPHFITSVNRKSNLWVEARLGNMYNMVDYLILNPQRPKIQNLVVRQGWKTLLEQILYFQQKNQLRLTLENERKIELIRTKLYPITSRLGMT